MVGRKVRDNLLTRSIDLFNNVYHNLCLRSDEQTKRSLHSESIIDYTNLYNTYDYISSLVIDLNDISI